MYIPTRRSLLPANRQKTNESNRTRLDVGRGLWKECLRSDARAIRMGRWIGSFPVPGLGDRRAVCRGLFLILFAGRDRKRLFRPASPTISSSLNSLPRKSLRGIDDFKDAIANANVARRSELWSSRRRVRGHDVQTARGALSWRSATRLGCCHVVRKGSQLWSFSASDTGFCRQLWRRLSPQVWLNGANGAL